MFCLCIKLTFFAAILCLIDFLNLYFLNAFKIILTLFLCILKSKSTVVDYVKTGGFGLSIFFTIGNKSKGALGKIGLDIKLEKSGISFSKVLIYLIESLTCMSAFLSSPSLSNSKSGPLISMNI